MRNLFLFSFVCITLASCGEKSKDEDLSSKNKESQAERTPVKKNQRYHANDDHLYADLHSKSDSIYFALAEWNRAINDSDFELMKKVYASKVKVFNRSKSINDLINTQKSRLKKYPNFSQKFELDAIQYSNIHTDVNRCFVSLETDPELEEEIGFLIISVKRINGTYKIIEIADEFDLDYEFGGEKMADLPLGKTSYEFVSAEFLGYEIGDGADDYMDVSNVRIDVTNTGSNIEVRFFEEYYDETDELILIDAKYENGYLSFKSSDDYVGDEISQDDYDEDDYFQYKFKVFKDHLGMIDSDGSEWEGYRFWKIPK